MSARKAPRQQSGWSTALRDDDDEDDSEPETSTTTPGYTRTARTQEASHDTADATPAYREGSDWDWNWAGDAVDIGLVPEPKELKFTETPFTLAKRNAKIGTAPAITKSTVRSAPPAQGPNRKLDDNSERANKGRPVQSSPSKPPRSPPIRQSLQKGLKTTTLGSRATPSSSEPHAVPRAPASSASNKQVPFKAKSDVSADRKKGLCATAQSPAASSKSDSRSLEPKAHAPHSSGFRPAKASAGPPASAQSTKAVPPQQIKVPAALANAAPSEGQDSDAIQQVAAESASSRFDSPSTSLDDLSSPDQAELFKTTLPSSEPDLPESLFSPTPAFQDKSPQLSLAQPARSNAATMQSDAQPIRPVPFKPFAPPLRHDPASLVSDASLANSPASFARSYNQAQAHAQSTPSARIDTASFYSEPDSAASSSVRPVRAIQQQQHKQGISPETRKRLDRFKRIGNFGLVGGSTHAADQVPADSQPPESDSAHIAAAGPATSPSSTRFTIPGLSTPLTDATKKNKRTSRLAFQPDEPLEAFQARSGLKPFSSLGGGGGHAHAGASSGSVTSSTAFEADPATPTLSIDYQRTGRERIVLGATVRSVRPVTFSGVRYGGSGPSQPSNARGRKGFKRPLPAARADWEADYGLADDGVPDESEDAKRRRLYRSLGL